MVTIQQLKSVSESITDITVTGPQGLHIRNEMVKAN